MSDPVPSLVLDLLEWIGPEPRPYLEVIEAWRTSCPRLPVWEAANEQGLLEHSHAPGSAAWVRVSAKGRQHLAARRPPIRGLYEIAIRVKNLGNPSRAAPRDVRARRIRPDDVELLDALFRDLAPRSRRHRLHFALNPVPATWLERLAHPDRCDEAGLIASVTRNGRELCVGQACYMRAEGAPHAREVAVAVADAWQRLGIGGRLLRRLARHARARGVGQLQGDLLRENQPMLALARSAGLRIERHPSDATLLRLLWRTDPVAVRDDPISATLECPDAHTSRTW